MSQITSNEMKNLVPIATAIALISDIALEVIGNDVAAVIDGEKITQSNVKVLAAATLNKLLSEKCDA
jgi:hypothetical protein